MAYHKIMSERKRRICELDSESIAFYRRNPCIACEELLGIKLIDSQKYILQQSGNSGSTWTDLLTVKDNGQIVANTFIGSLSGNATSATTANSATKATQDGAGNVITSKYVTIDTAQTISGAKTFSKEIVISNTTASTNKTTGALKAKGGISTEGQMSANKVMIGDECTLEMDEYGALNFVFL